MEDIQYLLEPRINYWVAVILLSIGLFAMIGKNNLIKKLIGMSIFQSAIILFYISMAVKEDSTIPILPHDLIHAAHEHTENVYYSEALSSKINVDDYGNPLPHVLMLTAIVVGVATLGVALATTQKIYSGYGTLEEPEINEAVRREEEVS